VVLLAFIIIVPIRVFLFQPFFVQGASMEPNFEDGNYLIINELGYKETTVGIGGKNILTVVPYKKLSRGEVAVFRYPKDPSKFFIKRVIGLPGEKVEIKNNQVIIYNSDYPDGKNIDESAYLSKTVKTTTSMNDFVMNLRDNEFFVMGDNRMYSSDSRVWGPVPDSDIVGKVVIRAWPLTEAAAF
jgi:signal peptidase I